MTMNVLLKDREPVDDTDSVWFLLRKRAPDPEDGSTFSPIHPRLIKEFGIHAAIILGVIHNMELTYGEACISVRALSDISGQPYGTVRRSLLRLDRVLLKDIGTGDNSRYTYTIDKKATV